MDTQTRLETAPAQLRKRRSAGERLHEEEARLARLRAQAALQEARSTEEGLTLVSELETLKEHCRAAKLVLSDGPQGHKARIEKKLGWVARYERELVEAQELLDSGNSQIEAIQSKIQALADSLNSEGATE
jgi:DNA repair ATPase RecN